MIPIELLSRDGSFVQKTRLAALLLACALLAGCTNSKLIIGPLYNQLDNQIRSEFEKLGDFNESQTAAFDEAVGTYHVWHRQSEMPQYAALVTELAGSIAQPGATTHDDVKRWSMNAERHSRLARECHPVNFLFDTMQTLTDKQITFIENRFKKERKKNRERYESRTREERIKRRLKNLGKWAGRIGFELSANQRAMLRTSLTRQVSLRKEYYQLSDAWNKELFRLARNQEATDYKEQLTNHMTKLWSLLESAHAEQWQANNDLWTKTSFNLISSMSPEQRSNTSRWLSKMGKTIAAISEDEPSFQVGSDPSVGCLVDNNS